MLRFTAAGQFGKVSYERWLEWTARLSATWYERAKFGQLEFEI